LAEGSAPPRKISRLAPITDDGANPFFDGDAKEDAKEDPNAPISFVRSIIISSLHYSDALIVADKVIAGHDGK